MYQDTTRPAQNSTTRPFLSMATARRSQITGKPFYTGWTKLGPTKERDSLVAVSRDWATQPSAYVSDTFARPNRLYAQATRAGGIMILYVGSCWVKRLTVDPRNHLLASARCLLEQLPRYAMLPVIYMADDTKATTSTHTGLRLRGTHSNSPFTSSRFVRISSSSPWHGSLVRIASNSHNSLANQTWRR